MKSPDGYKLVSSPSTIAWHIAQDMITPALCGKRAGTMSGKWIYNALEIPEGLLCQDCIALLSK
jgi:hypothetical protein